MYSKFERQELRNYVQYHEKRVLITNERDYSDDKEVIDKSTGRAEFGVMQKLVQNLRQTLRIAGVEIS